MMAYLTPVQAWIGDPPRLKLDASTSTRARARRLTRTATLDGGAVVNDGGYSQADRTFSLVVIRPSREDWATLEEIAQLPAQRVSLEHGLYEGRVSSLAYEGGATATITFFVSSRVTP